MRKNVLFITSDQQQATAMGIVDSSYVTPNLDELAKRGVRFENVISTSAQCAPARASWETGRYPHQVGVNQIGHAMNPELDLVAKEFKKAGYSTAHFGKWHLYTDRHLCGYEVVGGDDEDVASWTLGDQHATTQVMDYLTNYDDNRPFFIALSYYSPHPGKTHFELVETYQDLYPLEGIPVPKSYYADDLTTKPLFQKERAESSESRLTESQVRIDGQKYRTMVTNLDSNIGQVIAFLDRAGLLENTAIVFTSDHGDLQGAHRLRLKGTLPYRELYNVPLLIVDPYERGEGNAVVNHLVSSAAVPGTLLDLAGIDIPPSFEGGTLLSYRNQDHRPQQLVFFEHYRAYWGLHPFIGVQSERYKYTYYYGEDVEEMYDLQEDPLELTNVAERPDLVQVKHDLRQQVQDWWERTGALRVEPIKATNVRGVWKELL
ncbi:sulfatase family protein [Alicyclobacillus mengziensis]|uniref:Sulfatase-like hydrolase/transferase n=1 Tax=Alicyclobacillus mengziensis TaxID=2931921 RepID=A0A9X7VYZ0_9BACL|nr:sulfatase-like hydrolase/transferase [Alicyclobacillus mengziensis]QSO47395.1 sulfatase-like hydrolase/transferase [Alicyclobacillus mengziensis]